MDDDEVEIQQLRDRLAEAEARRAARLNSEISQQPARASKPDSVTKPVLIALGLVLGLGFVVATVFGGDQTTAPPPSSQPTATQARIAAEIAAREGPSGTRWVYTEQRDPMTDRLSHTACVQSTNEVRQDWPYQSVSARLCVRSSPQYGLDAFVALNGEGQIICRAYRDCATKVRFDDRPQQAFSAGNASDGSTHVMFITNAARMVEGLKAAEVTRIELTIYQAGTQPIEFPTRNLEWPRPATTPAAR